MTRGEAIEELSILLNKYQDGRFGDAIDMAMTALEQEPKAGHCKDCKYFEYDSMAKVDGIPLIVAHEICSRWGDGCKTREDGYCFLFEPRENCDTCKHKDEEWDSEPCDGCCGNHSGFEQQESEEQE